MSLVACWAVGSQSGAAASVHAMACEVKSFPAEILSAQGNEEATNELRGKSEYDTAQRGIEDQRSPSGPRGLPPGLHRDHAELCAGVSLLSQPNQINVLVQSSTLGILAIGLAAVFFTGGMDLSLRANMALSVIVGRGRAGGQGASAQRQICSENTLFVVATLLWQIKLALPTA